jgi:energy-coupling factor transporter ATP-binding protein EcfA2
MPPRIADLVEVTAADTVVRLDGAPGRLDQLVLTGDVTRSLTAVLEAAQGPTGAGFLLVGHFGSGKSHFLAALAELLADPASARPPRIWDGRARELALSARPSLAVAVPLVEYRAEANLEDVTWRRAWRALDREPPPLGSDRAAAWAELLGAVRAAGRAGLLLVVDELSEFLRAKRGPALTEDLRFLQFLGEWARQGPVLVVAALQESLEEVASVSERELARIRDRYPLRLSLSMRHVEDLVRGRLVPLRPGA